MENEAGLAPLRITRRDFLRIGAAGIGSALLNACTAPVPPSGNSDGSIAAAAVEIPNQNQGSPQCIHTVIEKRSNGQLVDTETSAPRLVTGNFVSGDNCNPSYPNKPTPDGETCKIIVSSDVSDCQ